MVTRDSRSFNSISSMALSTYILVAAVRHPSIYHVLIAQGEASHPIAPLRSSEVQHTRNTFLLSTSDT
jgi:hypothetical protein